MDVLHFHIGVGPPRFTQQEVDPAVLAIALFGPDRAIAPQSAIRPSANASATTLFGTLVSIPAMCPPGNSTSRQPYFSFLPGIVVGFQPDPQTRRIQAHHRAGVRAMRRDLATVLQQDIGEKAFVAPDEARGLKRRLKAHDPGPIPGRSVMP
jgi:hypothetical protein